MRAASPEAIGQVHEEAFSKLAPEQRKMLFTQLSADAPTGDAPVSDEPRALAVSTTRSDMRQPGTMERALGQAGQNGPGFGSMFASSLLGSVAGYVIASTLMSAFMPMDMGGDMAGESGTDTGTDTGSDFGGSETLSADGGGFDDAGFGDAGFGDFGDFGF